MSLRDRVSDLEKHFAVDPNCFAQKCETYAQRECESAVRYGEKSIACHAFQVKGTFRKIKYVCTDRIEIRALKTWNESTPVHITEAGGQYIVRSTKEAKDFIASIVSRLEKEGFKCRVEYLQDLWQVKPIFEWR